MKPVARSTAKCGSNNVMRSAWQNVPAVSKKKVILRGQCDLTLAHTADESEHSVVRRKGHQVHEFCLLSL